MAGPGISVQDLQKKYKLSKDMLDTEVSKEHLEEASRIIADHEILGAALGLTSAEIIQGRRPEIQRLEMLRKWKQQWVWKATYRILIEALLKWKRADYARGISELLAQSKCKHRALGVDMQSPSPLVSSSLVVAGAPPEQPSVHTDHSAAHFTSGMSPDGATSTDETQHGMFSSYQISLCVCVWGGGGGGRRG